MSSIKKFFHHRKEEKVSTAPSTSSVGSSTSGPAGTTTTSTSTTTTAASTSTAPTTTSPAGLAPTTYSPTFTSSMQQPTTAGNAMMEEERPRHVQSGGMGPTTMGAGIPQGPQQLSQPSAIQTVQRQPVIQEKIQQIEKDVIQPVVHREREQTEIHKITQPLTQVEVRPAVVEEKVLPAEMRPVIREQPRAMVPEVQLRSSTVTAPPSVSVVQEQPIVEEIVHKVVREEIQPVVYKQTVIPTVIHQQKPIYERIIEAPIILKEERAPIILREGETFTNMLGQQPRTVLSGQGEGPFFVGQPPISALESKLQNVSLSKVPTTVTDSVTTTTTTTQVQEPVRPTTTAGTATSSSSLSQKTF